MDVVFARRGFLNTLAIIAAIWAMLFLAGPSQALAQCNNCTAGCDACCPCNCDDGWGVFSDSFFTREHLTGDWFGARPAMEESGIVADLRLTQFFQGVASGGSNQKFKYGGKQDYIFTLVGGLAVVHAETRFGEDVIFDAAGLAPVNANMLYPSLQNETAITGLQFNLPLSQDQEWIFTCGKINTYDLFNAVYPQTGRGIDGFMNASVFLPLTVSRTVPLSFMGAGVLKMRETQIQGGLLVYDSNNVPTTSGFEHLFDNGANIAGLWRFFTDFAGLPGSHLFLGTWASGTYTSLDPIGWAFVPDVGLVAPEETGSWSALYVFEQKLWVDPEQQHRNVGVLSQWGFADPQTCPYEWTCNVSLQAQGFVERRSRDSVGVGYFYSGLSSELKQLFEPVLPLNDLHGVELYYNAAITPWFQLTTDLQIVEPANSNQDTAVVVGFRGSLDL